MPNGTKLDRKPLYKFFFIKIAHFAQICQQTWSPRAILVSDWLIQRTYTSPVIARQNGTKLDRRHPYKVILSSPGHRPCELLKSLGVCCPLETFHSFINSSKPAWPNGTKLESRHLYKVRKKYYSFLLKTYMATMGNT